MHTDENKRRFSRIGLGASRVCAAHTEYPYLILTWAWNVIPVIAIPFSARQADILRDAEIFPWLKCKFIWAGVFYAPFFFFFLFSKKMPNNALKKN